MFKRRLEAGSGEWRQRTRTRPETLVSFTRQLALLYKSGIALPRALEALTVHQDDQDFPAIVSVVAGSVYRGASLSQALSLFPRVFNASYVAMVRLGEAGGRLDIALAHMSRWLESDYHVMRRMKSALTYPVIVVCLTVLLTLGVFWAVIPRFASMFAEMGVALPWMTRCLIGLAAVAGSVWTWLAVILLGIVGTHRLRAKLDDETGRRELQGFLFRVPVVGRILAEVSLTRYCACMEALFSCGGDLVSNLRLAAQASGNEWLVLDSARAVQSLKTGLSLSQHLARQRDVYPRLVANMVHAGEEVGRPGHMFGRLAAYYDMEVGYQVETLASLLEPIMLTVVSVLLAFILVSMFLPMYSILEQMTG